MKTYLLPSTGNFYKANLHCHTTYSDGRLTPQQVKELYLKKGYSVVAYTDHDILIPHDELNDENFLALHGFEMEIDENRPDGFWAAQKCCHICFIGIEPENLTQPCWHRSKYLFGNAGKYRGQVKFDESEPDYERSYSGKAISEIMEKARAKGFFVTYNHPVWSREDYRDYTAYTGMHAMEIMNGGCMNEGFEDYNPKVYDDMLRAGKRIYCIGADDNHNVHPETSRYSDSGIAFTMVKADKLDYRSVTNALVEGNFYASEGPEITELWMEDGKVHVKCSPADRVLCTYDVRKAGRVLSEGGVPVTEASFEVGPEFGYFRITVVDNAGRHACTNAYFLS